MIHASVGCIVLLCAGTVTVPSQQIDSASVIQKTDAAVAARTENVLGFTAIEHYAVYRGNDQRHPVAEMTVKDTYRKGVGKSITILSESGSTIILKFGLHSLLDNDQQINLPGNLEKSWFVSANYDMKLKQAGTVQLNGRDCYLLEIRARRKLRTQSMETCGWTNGTGHWRKSTAWRQTMLRTFQERRT